MPGDREHWSPLSPPHGIFESLETSSTMRMSKQVKPIREISVFQSLDRVWLFETPWADAYQDSLSFTVSRRLLKLTAIERWCHPTISSSVVPFSACLLSFVASGSSGVWSEVALLGLPWWPNGQESVCQCWGHGFDPRSREIPQEGAPQPACRNCWSRRALQPEEPHAEQPVGQNPGAAPRPAASGSPVPPKAHGAKEKWLFQNLAVLLVKRVMWFLNLSLAFTSCKVYRSFPPSLFRGDWVGENWEVVFFFFFNFFWLYDG